MQTHLTDETYIPNTRVTTHTLTGLAHYFGSGLLRGLLFQSWAFCQSLNRQVSTHQF